MKNRLSLADLRAGYSSRARAVQCMPALRRQGMSASQFDPHARRNAPQKVPAITNGIIAPKISACGRKVQNAEEQYRQGASVASIQLRLRLFRHDFQVQLFGVANRGER